MVEERSTMVKRICIKFKRFLVEQIQKAFLKKESDMEALMASTDGTVP